MKNMGFSPAPTPLAGERLRPLGHISVDPFSGQCRWGQGQIIGDLGKIGWFWALPVRRGGLMLIGPLHRQPLGLRSRNQTRCPCRSCR